MLVYIGSIFFRFLTFRGMRHFVGVRFNAVAATQDTLD
jgi:hypothetical protein